MPPSTSACQSLVQIEWDAGQQYLSKFQELPVLEGKYIPNMTRIYICVSRKGTENVHSDAVSSLLI